MSCTQRGCRRQVSPRPHCRDLYIIKRDKMQSETANFAPVLPSGELDETYASFLILSIRAIMWKRDVIYKTVSTQLIALRSDEHRVTATGNMYRKFGEILTCGFWDNYARGQINRQTRYHNISNQQTVAYRSTLTLSVIVSCQLPNPQLSRHIQVGNPNTVLFGIQYRREKRLFAFYLMCFLCFFSFCYVANVF